MSNEVGFVAYELRREDAERAYIVLSTFIRRVSRTDKMKEIKSYVDDENIVGYAKKKKQTHFPIGET